jgi:hypothetical protein
MKDIHATPQVLKREYPAPQNNTFLLLFLFLRVILPAWIRIRTQQTKINANQCGSTTLFLTKFQNVFFKRDHDQRKKLGCGVAQLVARRLAVRRARVRVPIRHPREVSATELFRG